MSRDFLRSRRIEEQIQRVLSDIIRTRVNDPRLRLVVISSVKVSRDISVAWIYYSTLDKTLPVTETKAALEAATGFLRAGLARELTVRRVPELRFRFEDTDKGMALERLIDKAVGKEGPDNDPENGQQDG